MLPTYEEVQLSRNSSNNSLATSMRQTGVRKSTCTFKNFLLAIVMFFSTILLSGVVIGITSMKYENLRLSGMLLILLGVVGVAGTTPCCFFYYMKLRRLPVLRRESAESDDSSPPAIVSDIYQNGRDNPAMETDGPVSNRSGSRLASRRELYEPPPPYTLVDSSQC